MTTDIEHIAHLVSICAVNGIREVVLSPGSRNAPLIIAFDDHPDIKTYLIHDERSAAFFALGLSESLNRPVAICCTSGSAPLNYSPAIAEAYYRRQRLLILTADRPTELIDQGDGQTIRQKYVYDNFIKTQFELPNHDTADLTKKSDQIVCEAVKRLNTQPFGPVHINIPLAEPLYGQTENLWQAKLIDIDKSGNTLTIEDKEHIQSSWKNYEKKLILIGQNDANYNLPKSLEKVIQDPSVAILVENTSNIRDHQNICHCIDRTLGGIKEEEFDNFRPDLLITLGGAVVSKRIKKYFRKYKPKTHWRVGKYLFEEDTFGALTRSFNVAESIFFEPLTEIPPNSNFGGKWKQRDFITEEKHMNFLDSIPFSDLKAFDFVLSALPENSNLHMANSSVVRYCQLFRPVRTISYFSNRGVSGIDGSSSTAVGMANGSNKLMTLITGDISFFYDSNALWSDYLSSNLRIVLINNGGGGIFRYIPGPSDTKQIDYFVAKHSGNARKLCDAFNIHYLKAENDELLDSSFETFFGEFDDERPALLEIDTSELSNETVLKTYFDALSTQ